MGGILKNPKQYEEHFPSIFYLLCCASQRHVLAMRSMEVQIKVLPEAEFAMVGALEK